MYEKIMARIKNHPRSQVALAFKLGQAEGDGLLPLAKLVIRAWILRDRGVLRTPQENRELGKIRDKLLALTK